MTSRLFFSFVTGTLLLSKQNIVKFEVIKTYFSPRVFVCLFVVILVWFVFGFSRQKFLYVALDPVRPKTRSVDDKAVLELTESCLPLPPKCWY